VVRVHAPVANVVRMFSAILVRRSTLLLRGIQGHEWENQQGSDIELEYNKLGLNFTQWYSRFDNSKGIQRLLLESELEANA
jgi:hypothetical protein